MNKINLVVSYMKKHHLPLVKERHSDHFVTGEDFIES